MTLYSSTDINIQKPNSVCQARGGLGDCSTICIPTELSRTCACEDGVSLKADQRTCENIYQCPILLEQKVTSDTGLEKTIEITIDRTCARLLHDKCNYECPNNYEPLFGTEMSCTSAGWSMESRTLCKEVRCPLTVGNGKIVGDCKREVGDKCEYQCNTGFIQTRTAAVCTKTGQYHEPEGGFCTPFKCSDTIENGMMGKDCTRLTGSTCDYMCNKFYAPNPKYPKAQCQGTGWSPNSSSLCQETTCQADSFPNGQFSPTCLHKIGDACTFTCKPGYVKTTELAFCKNDKMWHPEDACSAFKCGDKIKNGYLDKSCSMMVGSTCNYYCDKFYDPADKKGQAKCESSGWTPTELCKESICEDTSLTNGKVIGSCSKKIGIDCAVECNQGYVNMTDKAFCRNDKKWYPLNACTEYTCSVTIANGALDQSCSRAVGSTCSYKCDKHYNATSTQATCTADGWSTASGNLCQAVSCPSSVPNGRISATCDLTVGSTCNYKCNSGYEATEIHPNVTCKRTGKWVTDNLCLVPSKSKSAGLSVPGATAGLSVLGILVLVLIVLVVCLVWRKKRSASKYSNFDDTSSVAIENPGYRQRRSFPDPDMDDPQYVTSDVAQMKPVTTTSFASPAVLDDGNL
ncbi:complement factor H-like [Ruditapes philippinarum]|uniref:complement factor H-like n=1 Tax=Ruditapes philippinarum TaxID=129788 RepID=UPI00295A59A3|nr:complement factor H-like [Ruditapes philippinarum]